MDLNRPIDISSQQGARDFLQEVSEHYNGSGVSGRVSFNADASAISGLNLNAQVWDDLTLVGQREYTEAKTAFAQIVETAYPEHAETILSHMEQKGALQGAHALTIDMLVDAHKTAQDAQRLGWPAGTDAGSLVATPNGHHPSHHDMAKALNLMKDNEKPHIPFSGNPAENAQLKGVLQLGSKSSIDFVACHDTAAQLQSLMGVSDTKVQAGGAGPDGRAEAIRLAVDFIDTGKPGIISIKGSASADGHSFSLVVKPDGKVDVLEAWASREHESDLGRLLAHSKKNLSLQQAKEALQKLTSPDLEVRTQGYTALSRAYRSAADFELVRDPQRGERAIDLRDQDEKISIVATVSELKPKQEIMDEMDHRLALLHDYHQDIRLTRTEYDVLRQVQFEGLVELDVDFGDAFDDAIAMSDSESSPNLSPADVPDTPSMAPDEIELGGSDDDASGVLDGLVLDHPLIPDEAADDALVPAAHDEVEVEARDDSLLGMLDNVFGDMDARG